jgi:DNA-binding transcriptional ArsR family regulator
MSATRAEHASLFAALGDATRLAIVARLAKGAAQSITQLTAGAGVTRQAITKHLRVLEAAGIVRREPIGREMVFLLEPEPLATLQAYLERVSRQWLEAAE